MDAKTKQPPWPADKVERRKISKLNLYERNPRLHSDAQVDQLAASIQQWGWTIPVLIDEKGVVIAGHGRIMAAKKLGIADVPVMVARKWTEAQKNAYRIADNQLTLASEWDMPLLSAELKQLHLSDFDMPLLGFPDLQLVEFLAMNQGQGSAEDEGGEQPELEGDDKALMISAWQRMVCDWSDIIDKQSLSTNYTRGALAVHFVRARFFGADIPAAATLAYTPHRVLTAAPGLASGGSIADAVRLARTNERNFIERFWFVLGGVPKLDKLLAGTLGVLGFRSPGDFPSGIARDLINEFVTEPGGRVLDPCHGWGGRVLGFLLSRHAMFYHGFDTDERTSRGVAAMFTDLQRYAEGIREARFEQAPFEDGKLKADTFDFALTSPPYFDTERYGGELSSWKRYDTFDKWVAGFYRPLIEKTARALKSGAVFALQIGSQNYPLEETAKQIAPDAGLDHVETRAAGMINNYTETDAERGERIVILKRE